MDISGATAALQNLPTGWLVVAIVFIVIAADALRGGPSRASALALSLPIAWFLFQTISHTAFLSPFVAKLGSPLEQAVIFIMIEAVLFFCINSLLVSYDPYTSFTSSVIAGAVATIVAVVIWMQVPALRSLWDFGPQIQTIFGTSYAFFWLIAGYLVLGFTRG